ncbi:hypothetical protein IXB50_01680 [Leptothoe spongobia TAU-MAC 1115]|uniref:Uncharacterized protein n=2 Tax=Leptothoe TaxID=2651725 RepID=A0A947DBK7_9CYAN|nr:hypothetical protein [Leptothoe spongobia TAU-MAC 1115]
MWPDNASICILNDALEKRQAFDSRESQVLKLERILAMNDADRSESILAQLGIPKRYDAHALEVALYVQRSPKRVGRKAVQIATSLTLSVVTRRLKWLVADGYLDYEEKPLPNPKMPASRLYSSTGRLTEEDLQLCLQELQAQEALPIKPLGGLTEVTPPASPLEAKKKHEGRVSVRSAISKLRPYALQDYVQLLLIFVAHGELSMRQAAELSGDAPQTQHGRFTKLTSFGLLKRERKRSEDGILEFHYSLVPGVSSDEIVELAREHNISTNQSNESSTPETVMTSDSKANQLPEKQRQSATEMLVARLPEFDPSWPQEVKQSWFESYQKLIEMSQK